MIKNSKIIYLFILILLSNCSFDNVTGIWSGSEKEKKRISDLAMEQNRIISTEKIYSPDQFIYSTEILLKQNIILTKPKKNSSWEMSTLNHQNFLGNIYLTGAENIFFKKKIGKNKFDLLQVKSSPLISENNIILSDDRGSIFFTSDRGNVIWKKNIYKKIYKKIYKNLNFTLYNDNLYVADNIGFIYAISLDSGKVIWIKNHGIPFKSNIKIFKDKIYAINQDNRILSFNTKDGSKLWDVRSISSFIKSQNFLSIAVTKQGNVVVINSSGDLIKIKGSSGGILWSVSTSSSLLVDATDFFKSSNLVIDDNAIFFSAESSFYSYNLSNGSLNWSKDISFTGTPIIDKKNIFFVTDNGYFVIMDKANGEIISSTNILKILKKRKQATKITGFIMGSGKIYSVTLNGYLIVTSASSGQVEYFKKIGEDVVASPVISDGNLYIVTRSSKIIGFN